MKKLILFFLVISLQIYKTEAQITLEQVYNVPPGKTFYYTDLGNNNYKYFFIDYFNSTFSLYNLDHSPYLLNVSTGVPLDSAKFTIGYISSTLFDCDSTNIEYAITANGGSTVVSPFYVFRTDGTLLFQKDSVVTVWCFGCFGGVTVAPIFNTSDGAKLLLANLNSNDWFVYSLCDNLPLSLTNIELENHFVKIYPNPALNSVTIHVNPPNSTENYEVIVYNSLNQVIKNEKFQGISTLIIEGEKFSSGIYYFTFRSNSKIFQTGKFIISK